MSRMNLSNSFEEQREEQHNDEERDTEPPPKKKKIIYEYEEVNTLSTEEELEAYRQTLKKELFLKKEADGEKAKVFTYACKEFRRGCDYVLLIKCPHDNQMSYVSQRSCGHDHSIVKETELSKEVKLVIEKHCKETAALLQQRLIDEKLPIPKKKQIDNLLARIRASNGGTSLNEHQLILEVEKHMRNDEMELKGYACYSNLGMNGDKLDFLISFTTPHLMKKQQSQKYLQVDATWKISWKGFPLLLAGFSDANRRFHPTMLGIVSRECRTTYAQLLKEIKEFDEERPYSPAYIMGDGATSITNASNDVFDETSRLMCYFHLRQRIKQKVKEFKLSENQQVQVKSDIDLLRAAADTHEFMTAAQWMTDHWQQQEIPEEFIRYFENEWINSSLDQWFSGCSDYGTTNNGLESTNNAIKNQITLRRRHSVKELIGKLIKAVEYYSKAPEFSVNARQISVTEAELKAAYDYKQKKPVILEFDDRQIFYAQPSNIAKEEFESAVDKRRGISYDNEDWNSYSKIVQVATSSEKLKILIKLCFAHVLLEQRNFHASML